MRHDPPRYYGYAKYYRKGFATITKCDNCGCVALYEDAHPVNPCRHCGGKVREAGAAKWEPQVLSDWKWFSKRHVVKEGYWRTPKEGLDHETK